MGLVVIYTDTSFYIRQLPALPDWCEGTSMEMRTRPGRLFLPEAAADPPGHEHSAIVKSWDYPGIPQI